MIEAGNILSWALVYSYFLASLAPRPLPDFISQPWRKIGEGLGSKLRHEPEMVDSVSTNRVHHSQTGNGGLGLGSKLRHEPEMVDSVSTVHDLVKIWEWPGYEAIVWQCLTNLCSSCFT